MTPGPTRANVCDVEHVKRGCNRWLNGHGRWTAADFLSTIPLDTELDHYGEGGIVSSLEREIAAILGKESALFFVSGTMAQQATLRVHADRRQRRGVVWHPACHLDWREGRGYARLHGLTAIPAGRYHLPLTLSDLESVGEPISALLLELPQRDLGGRLPTWDELCAMTAWGRARGAAIHLDGARLWKAVPFYARPVAEIARLFDTVYVSFQKDLGAIAGCAIAGSREVIVELAEWRIRHGGRVPAMWPYAASSLWALRERRSRMPEYWAHAKAIATAVSQLDGVRVCPNPPDAPMMHIQIRATADELHARALEIARSEGVWTFSTPYASDDLDLQRIELSIGDSTLGFEPSEVKMLFARLAGL